MAYYSNLYVCISLLNNCLRAQVSLIARSDADIAIFGGDLNAGPIESPRHPYGMLRTVMKVSAIIEDFETQHKTTKY